MGSRLPAFLTDGVAAIRPISLIARSIKVWQRARIAARTVVPLAKAARAVMHGRGDDLLHARLCERDGRLVYLLTVLARGGKVLRVAVDAGSGTLIDAQR